MTRKDLLIHSSTTPASMRRRQTTRWYPGASDFGAITRGRRLPSEDRVQQEAHGVRSGKAANGECAPWGVRSVCRQGVPQESEGLEDLARTLHRRR